MITTLINRRAKRYLAPLTVLIVAAALPHALASESAAQSITEYPILSGSESRIIIAGPDGNLWFTENGYAQIGKITPAGVITEYATPTGYNPYAITAGPESCCTTSPAAEPKPTHCSVRCQRHLISRIWISRSSSSRVRLRTSDQTNRS